MPAEQRQLTRAEQREQGAEGRLAPVVLALALSAVLGTLIGWLLLSRDVSEPRSVAPPQDQDRSTCSARNRLSSC